MQSSLRLNTSLLVGLAPLILLVIYAALIWPALSGPFVFDDFPNLQNLELLGGNVSDNLGRYLASFIGSPGRPIAALSFLINDNGWPSDPFSFKYTNLMIHLLNGVLLFGLLRQLANTNPALPQSPFWPLLAMAAWLFHPLQLSAQMLVVQRMTLLSAMFCFIGLWGYVALLQRTKSLLGDFVALSVLGTCTILAILCKENGALLPLFAWVLNATLLRGVLENKSQASRRFVRTACILPSLAVFATMIYMATRPGTFSSREFSMAERFMTQMHVLADYLRHILMPRLSGSGIYFDDYPITRSWTQPISTLLLAVGFLASMIFAIVRLNRFPVLSFGILWFFAGHAMESSFLNLELFFEHRNYLPLLGPVVALSAWAFLPGSRKHIGAVLFSIWLLLLGGITSLQAPVWGNAELMTRLWVSERPLSLRAAQDLAKFRYDHGQEQAALNGLMEAYDNGIKHADLPMAGLLVKCWTPTVHSDRNLYLESLTAAKSSSYSNSVLKTLLLLRQAAQEDNCNNVIDKNQWLELSDALLANAKFRMVAEDYIRIERAKFYIHQRNLDLTMGELERAFAISPTVELSQKIAEVLLSAGLTEEAYAWLEKGLQIDQNIIEKTMYDPKAKSISLQKAILKLKIEHKTENLHESKLSI